MRAFVLSSLAREDSDARERAATTVDHLSSSAPARRRAKRGGEDRMVSAKEYDEHATRAYYDEFSQAYEVERRPNRPAGYHALVDDLEVGSSSAMAPGGTFSSAARVPACSRTHRAFRAIRKGIDLSPGNASQSAARVDSTCARRGVTASHSPARRST